jgi:hypothetical protein
MIVSTFASAIHGFLAQAAPTPSGPPNPGINTDGILAAIARYIAPLLLAGLGVIFISRAGKGEMSKVLTSSAIAIIGIAFIVGSAALFLFGQNLVNLIFNGTNN